MSLDVIRDCRLWFGIPDIKVSVVKRKKKFLMKYVNSARLSRVIFLSLFFLLSSYYHVYGDIKLCITPMKT